MVSVDEMSSYITVAEDEGDEPIELPPEEDLTLLLTTLSAQFPGAGGLKFRNPEARAWRGVRLSEGRLYPPAPDTGWGTQVYVCVLPKGEQEELGRNGYFDEWRYRTSSDTYIFERIFASVGYSRIDSNGTRYTGKRSMPHMETDQEKLQFIALSL